MKNTSNRKSITQILKILSHHRGLGVSFAANGDQLVLKLSKCDRIFPVSLLRNLQSSGLVQTCNQRISIVSAGISFLKRELCDHQPYISQHGQIEQSTTRIFNKHHPVIKNTAESPLARLYSRKQKNGLSYITIQEYQAGDRLRNDFERAGLQPSITVRWNEAVSTGSKFGSGSAAGEMSDIAIDARKRLEKAINIIGPELSGVTLDICCFLKGFEIVERERNWPSRSAKLIIKMALSILARHYGYTMSAKYSFADRKRPIDQWGTADYRPRQL
ncbi:MAG: DUF6456 domain-containing protein [Rhizobiaceae bacterium]|nr:DUF6456 domain-containing protein [Rhizobiaceae bacterium]